MFFRSSRENTSHEDFCFPFPVIDNFTAPEVFDLKSEMPIPLVEFVECGVGVASYVRFPGWRIDKVAPVLMNTKNVAYFCCGRHKII